MFRLRVSSKFIVFDFLITIFFRLDMASPMSPRMAMMMAGLPPPSPRMQHSGDRSMFEDRQPDPVREVCDIMVKIADLGNACWTVS